MDNQENLELVIEELDDPPQSLDDTYNPLDDPQFRCDVCKINFFKRYLSLNGNRKAVEKHKLTKTHAQNVERAAKGLPPEKHGTFTNMHQQMQELVDKMSMRIAELENLVKSVTEAQTSESTDESDSPSIADSVDEPRNQKQIQLHREPSEERNLPTTSTHQQILINPHERSVLCEYDGETLSNMRAVHVILRRLLLRLQDTSCGERYEKNFNFVNRTINAISLQLERLREGYPPNEDENNEIAYRLTQIAVHPF